MRVRRPSLACGAALLAALLLPLPASGAQSFLLQGHESVATADGALGTLFNPALVGLRYPSEMLFSGTLDEFGRGARYDGMAAWRGLGARYTRWPGAAQVAGFTLAGGGPALRMGWSAEWSGADLKGPAFDDHRIGLLSRPAAWLSIGATVEHVFQPRVSFANRNTSPASPGGLPLVGDVRPLARTYDLGVALRPLALPLHRSVAHTVGTRLTLLADALVAESESSQKPDWRFGFDMELVQGWCVRYAYETNPGRGHFGVAFRLPNLAFTAKALGVSKAGRTKVAAAGLSPYLPSGRALADAGRTLPDTWSTFTLSAHSGEDLTRLVPPGARRIGLLRIDGRLGDDDISGFSLLGGGGESEIPAGPIHEGLDRALADPLTRGVLLELGGASNMAALEELRPRLERLSAAGKPVVAYLEAGGGRGDLLLASACDRVFASEEALFWQLGLRSERRYYRKLLADWGLRVDRSSIGRYKSAYRTWSVDSTPPADREALEHVLDQAQDALVTTVSGARRMERARLETILDGRQWPPQELVRAGLIDSVGYRDQALAAVGKLAGLGARPRTVPLAAVMPAARRWSAPRGIAIVYASGGLESGASGNDLLEGPTLGAATLVRQIESAFRASGARAVVLRIDSPGGSVLASNLIHHALERMKRETKKPLVVSMGSVAASGGYYIALPGNRIFADRLTRTGSIGVLFTHPSLEGWYARHGVKQEDFERGAWMRAGSLARDWDAEVQASADSALARTYDRFVDRVVAARGMTRERVLEVAQGRVWLGEDARERGLVDEIGGLDAAIAWARKAAGIAPGERIEPLEFRRPRPGLLQRVAGSWLRETLAREARFSLDPEMRFESGGDLEF